MSERIGETMATTTPKEVATLLARLLSPKQIAPIVDALLSCEDDPSFTDREAEIGSALFDVLTDLCPAAVEIASRGI